MTTTLLKRHRTLLKAFLHSTGIPVTSLVTPGVISRGALGQLVNGEVTPNGGTLIAFREVLNAELDDLGQEPMSLEAIRHMLLVRPAPTDPADLARAIAKARRL